MAIDLNAAASRLNDAQKIKLRGVVAVFAADALNVLKVAKDGKAKALADGARKALECQHSACKSLSMSKEETIETLSNHVVYQEAQDIRAALKELKLSADEPQSQKKDEIDVEAMAAARDRRAAEQQASEQTIEDIGELSPTN